MVDLIISGIIILIITIYKIIVNIKYKDNYKNELYKKIKKQNTILYIVTIIIFIIALITTFIDQGITKNIIYIPITISVLALPLNSIELYKIYFKDEEKYTYIKKIITKEKITKELEKKYKLANIIITDDKKQITNDNTTIECNKKLDKLYEKIMNARSLHNRYINTIEYNYRTLGPLLITYILLAIIRFPIEYYLSLSLSLKLYTIISSNILYMKLPYDKDVETRLPKPLNMFIEKQEILFILIEILALVFGICIVYMYLLLINGAMRILNTIFITIFIYCNIFTTLVHFSESPLYKNIIKAIINIRFIIYLLISILFTIMINYVYIFNTIKMGLKNYSSSIIVAFICSISYELIKLARYTTVKGVKKNVKNNKRNKRSKSNNS